MHRIAACLFVLALFLPVPARTTTRDVTIGDNFYSPPDKTIQVGDTVRWTYPSSGGSFHSVSRSEPPETFDSSPSNCPGGLPPNSGCMMPGGTPFEHTFNTVGDFAYLCKVHGSAMTGTIHVVPKITQSPTPTPTATRSRSATPTASKSGSASPSASGSSSASPTSTASASPSGSSSTVAAPTQSGGGGGGAGPKVAAALVGVGLLGMAGYIVYRRFLAR